METSPPTPEPPEAPQPPPEPPSELRAEPPAELRAEPPEELPAAPPESQGGLVPRDIPIEFMLLFLPILIFFCYLLTPVAQRIDAGLRFPFEIDGEEGFVYLDAVNLRMGRPIYGSLDHEPYVVGNYPPLFAWVVSKSIDPGRLGLGPARMIVTLSALALVQLLIVIVFSRTRRLIPSFLAPLLFLVTYEFYNWAPFCRVDLPALALTLAGLLVFSNMRHRGWAVLSAGFFVLAAYTKVTAILAPAACCLSMLIWDRRRLAWFLIPYLGFGLGALAILNSATDGEFLRHVVTYNRNEMNWLQLRLILKNEIFFFYRWWIAAIAVGAIFLIVSSLKSKSISVEPPAKARFRGLEHARGVTAIYFVLAVLSLATFAKAGSAPNYALEPLAAAAIFGMETLGRLCDAAGGGRSTRRTLARAGVLAMAACCLGHTWRVRVVAPEMFSSRNPGPADVDVGRVILEAVRSADGEVLTEYPLISLIGGKGVNYEPFIMSRLAAEGMWDEEKILKPIRGRRFALIITSQDLRDVEKGIPLARFTPKMARTITRYYAVENVIRAAGRTGLGLNYYLWLPRTGQVSEPDSELLVMAN